MEMSYMRTWRFTYTTNQTTYLYVIKNNPQYGLFRTGDYLPAHTKSISGPIRLSTAHAHRKHNIRALIYNDRQTRRSTRGPSKPKLLRRHPGEDCNVISCPIWRRRLGRPVTTVLWCNAFNPSIVCYTVLFFYFFFNISI